MYECITYMCMYVLIFCRELEDLKNLKVAEFDSLKKIVFSPYLNKKHSKWPTFEVFLLFHKKLSSIFVKSTLNEKCEILVYRVNPMSGKTPVFEILSKILSTNQIIKFF